MRAQSSKWVEQHALMIYFVLAFIVTWSVMVPLATIHQGKLGLSVPFALNYLASFGPLLAASMVTLATDGSQGLKQLFAGLRKWRVGFTWWMICGAAPVALFLLAAVWTYLTTGHTPDLAQFGNVDYLPRLGIAGAVLLWLLTFGLGEEVGWRGFALPRLQQRHSALAASFWLSIPWVLWHLPAFFYRDTYIEMGVATGLLMLWLSIFAATIVFTWIFNSTNGSLLTVIIFHALFDFLSVSKAGGAMTATIMSAAVMVGAVLIVVWYGPTTLSRSEKQTTPGAGAGTLVATKV